MVKILIIDTETTGLFHIKGVNNKKIDNAITTKDYETTLEYFQDASWLNKCPYITQMSFIMYDTEMQCILKIYNTFIDIDIHIKIHKFASKITHIYTCIEDAVENGENLLDESLIVLSEIKKKHPQKIKSVEQMMCEFVYALDMCDCIVGHNISFDVKMLLVEAKRLNNLFYFKKIFEIKHECTMLQSIEVCNLMIYNKNGAYKKYPKLQEAYERLFDDLPKNNALHNALYDAYICLKIYCKLKNWKQPSNYKCFK
jgi:DNA polymerase III epsilon subunit-like protein